MPLTTPTVTRERLHRRSVSYDGFLRDDGMLEVEAHIVDRKDRDYELLTGLRPAGEPVHDMWVRVTFDRAYVIHAIEAVTDGMPYPGTCDAIGPAYARLVGANLVRGFRKRLYEAMGGVNGCTHITEMLSWLPTAAIQTVAGLVREDGGDHKPYQLDQCHALETTTDNVRRYYPRWYRATTDFANTDPATTTRQST